MGVLEYLSTITGQALKLAALPSDKEVTQSMLITSHGLEGSSIFMSSPNLFPVALLAFWHLSQGEQYSGICHKESNIHQYLVSNELTRQYWLPSLISCLQKDGKSRHCHGIHAGWC